jgi:hypothetical protein
LTFLTVLAKYTLSISPDSQHLAVNLDRTLAIQSTGMNETQTQQLDLSQVQPQCAENPNSCAFLGSEFGCNSKLLLALVTTSQKSHSIALWQYSDGGKVLWFQSNVK